jgi:FkbM family methyltransferase
MKFNSKTSSTPKDHYSYDELEKLKELPHGVKGAIEINHHTFHSHDLRCFYDSYSEIIAGEIYRFHTNRKRPLIIDCGANMGVSVLFFATQYPNARIIAFEPEDEIFNVLQRNITSYNLTNVEIHKKAVWDSETTLQFFTDHGMGGSLTNVFHNQEPTSVKTVKLADYLHETVDFLKLDIEGAEYTVLKDCEEHLKNVEHLFVEYHSFVDQEQHLEDLLQLLKKNGFRYHLRESFSQNRPFVDKVLACENMDMAINIFATRVDKIEDFVSERPFVSVCIPTYNGEEYIKACIDSVLAQTYTNLEILISDDGSTDTTLEIVNGYKADQKHIRIVQNLQKGMVANWNNCIKEANGEWIKFLFQDDILKADCIERMLTACVKYNSEVAICRREFIIHEDIPEKIKADFRVHLIKPEHIFEGEGLVSKEELIVSMTRHFLKNILGEPTCYFFKKEMVEKCGVFNSELRQLVDYEFITRLAMVNGFVFLPEPLAMFRIHNKSESNANIKTAKENIERKIAAVEGDWMVLIQNFLKNPQFSPVKEYIGADILSNYIRHIYYSGCKHQGKGTFRNGIKHLIDNKIVPEYRYNFLKYVYYRKMIKRWKRRIRKMSANQQHVL